MKPDRIKPFVSCLLGRLKENTEGPCGWGSQQDGLCIHLINQLAEGKERREVHVINTCFSLAFFPQKTGLEWHPQESPPSHPRHAGGLRGCSCDPPRPHACRGISPGLSGSWGNVKCWWGGWKGREWTCPVVSGLHFPILASPLKPYIFLHPPQQRNLHCQVEKCLPPEAGGARQVH